MTDNKQPYLVLISGPNGAGKTTFYNHIIKGNILFRDAVFINFNYSIRENALFQDAVFINQDIKFANIASKPTNVQRLQNIKYDISAKQKEIAEKLTLLNKEKTEKELEELLHQQKLIEFSLQQEAGIQTVSEINYSLEHGKNFIYETTGSGHFPQRLLKRAKNEYGYKIYSIHPYVYRPELSVARVQRRVQMGGHDVPADTIIRRYQNSLNNLPTILSLVDFGIVLDNSYNVPYRPIFMVYDGCVVNISKCPEYLKSAHDETTKQFNEKSIQAVELNVLQSVIINALQK